MNEYKKGDIVEAIKGSDLASVRGQVRATDPDGTIYLNHINAAFVPSHGWTITVVEPAAPKVGGWT